MKYGYFDDKNREYVINNPETPNPWINYIGNKNFYGLISNTCGGYTFYKDARLRRLTRYRYNDVPNDFNGRYYYIKDKDVVFNPGYKPTLTELDSYKCRHGLNYSIFESSKNNLSTKLTTFVPLEDNCEIHKLEITNNSHDNKELNIYSAIEFSFYDAMDDSTNFQRNLNIAEVEVENNAVYHKTEYRERRNHYTYFSCNQDIDGFDTDRDVFLGKNRSFTNPITIDKGISYNSMVSGNSPMASTRVDILLKPNETKTIIYLLGYEENSIDNKYVSKNVINKEKAIKIINKYKTTEMVDLEFDKLNKHWTSLLEKFSISSNDDKFNRMVNIWHQYQCMITYSMSRSASYFESGIGRGMGFRDSCQDLLGFVHLEPQRARERIIDIASIQFEDGSTYHQYQPLTKRGNSDVGGGFNDDPLWLVACTSAYIKETGDYSILDDLVPFNNKAGSEQSLFTHLHASVHYTLNNLGPHNLPLIGRADWNDCLNLNCFSEQSGESFQTTSNFESRKAESVFIAGMFVKYANEYVDICKLTGRDDEANNILNEISKMEQAVITDGWDGKWFLRAYDAFENPVGSKVNDEGKIFIEPQGFCTMAKIGESLDLGKKALESVDKYLVNDYGVELLHPCYTEYHKELGEITSYPPGFKENGSVFNHNNPWIVLAYIATNQSEKAFDIYRKNAPAYIEEYSDIHKTEPYVYSQTIAGRDSVNYGQAKNSWLTGTAAWTFVAASQGILGIIPDYNGLIINPHLPKHITKCTVSRKFRDVTYHIDITNNNTGKTTLFINDKPLSSVLINYDSSIKDVNIKVQM